MMLESDLTPRRGVYNYTAIAIEPKLVSSYGLVLQRYIGLIGGSRNINGIIIHASLAVPLHRLT